MKKTAKFVKETTPVIEETENFCLDNSKQDVVVSQKHSGNCRKTVGFTKKYDAIKCCRVEKRKTSISVRIITGVGMLLLASIIGKWKSHSEEDRRYHSFIVNYVNELNTTWKAAYNPFASRAVNEREIVLTTVGRGKISPKELLADTSEHLMLLKSQKIGLPEQFDARLRWPLCWSVHQVANQGGCGSCWALAASSVMSDRLCIKTNFTNQKQISAEDLISCCPRCGGCQGSHWTLSAFIYWRNHGIVTGGNYGSFEGCKPYAIVPDCGSPCSVDYYRKEVSPVCQKTCQPLYGLSYDEDLIRSQKAYWIRAERGDNQIIPFVKKVIQNTTGNDDPADLIKREIYLYGPVLACFTVREDFQHYRSGIFQTINLTTSEELYGHCAKLLGWGKENDLKYWIYMNTWGRHWGDYGFFRVIQSELPEEVIAGLP